jgi:hypothetical protein
MSEVIDNVLDNLEEANNSLRGQTVDLIKETFRKNPVFTVSEFFDYMHDDLLYDIFQNYQIVLVPKHAERV